MSTALTQVLRAELISRRRRQLGSITWGTRTMGTRNLGFTLPDGTTTDHNILVMPLLDDGSGAPLVPMAIPGLQPFPGNPDTRPGAWPDLNTNFIATDPGYVPRMNFNTPPPVQANTLPAKVPVIVTPTSGPIPAPGTVAAATAAPASWLEQSLIGGIANKWLLVGGIGAFLLFGGKKK